VQEIVALKISGSLHINHIQTNGIQTNIILFCYYLEQMTESRTTLLSTKMKNHASFRKKIK